MHMLTHMYSLHTLSLMYIKLWIMIVDIETKVLLRFHNLATLYVYGGAETVLKLSRYR